MLTPFFVGKGGRKLTPEEVDRERQLVALARAKMGDTSPVGHWTQGATRVVDALGAVLREKRTNKAEAAGLAGADERIAALLAGQGGGFGGGSYTASSSGGGSAPSGSWTPAAPGPSPVDVATQGVTGGMALPGQPAADPGVIGAQGGLDFGAAVMTPQEMLIEGARRRGLDPIDVATAISYETGGKFDPTIAGPTTQWGTHRGLIQFGEPQAKQYGADFSTPEAAWRSQLNPENGAIWNYLDGAGVKPGMGLPEIYSGINAGSVGRMGASDANNGGAPGTVADKVASMGPHREKAAAFLGGTWTPDPNASVTMSAKDGGGQSYGGGGDVGGLDIASILALQSDPWVAKKYGGVVDALMGQQFSRQNAMWEAQQRQNDPMYQAQLAELTAPKVSDYDARAAAAAQYGLQPGTPEYQRFVLAGDVAVAGGGEGFTLTPGQVRFDANGNKIAAVDAPPPDPTVPTTKNVTLSDGSEAMVQWNPETQVWDAAPIPNGGTGGTGQSGELTEGQAKLKLFETMQTETSPVLLQLESQFDPSNLSDPSLAKIPIAGNYFTSADYQKYNAAAAVWAESALRIASGANAPEAEVQRNVKTYFAQPGDTPETVAFKAQLRAMYGRAISAAQGNPSTGETLKLPTPTEFADEVAKGVVPPPADLPTTPTGNKTSSGVSWSIAP